MSGTSSAISFGKQIGMLFDLGALGAMPDRKLLELFARGGEASEAAFATLVERHGPMVLRVCRHVLADGHLAEDAFQVTFLLLARRARSIHDPDALAGWLHRVGRRVALRARAGIHRRTDRETQQSGDVDVAVAAVDKLERDELCAVVHDEIDRLADAQRLPILLCALEGLSHEEAAQRLGWPLGTIKSRLVRGRKRLQGRLARRGLAPEHAYVRGIDDVPANATPVPLVLALATTRAALRSCPGAVSSAGAVSPSIALLLQRELTAMLLAKIKLAAGAAIASAAAILVGITMAGSLFGRGQEPVPVEREQQPVVGGGALDPEPVDARGNDRPVARKPAAVADVRQERQAVAARERRLSAFGKDVLRSIHGGAAYLKSRQLPDGSWADVEQDAKTGMTSLVVLALVAAGEKADSAAISKALEFLRRFGTDDLKSTYAISLQTMALAATGNDRDRLRIAENARWLERAQIKLGGRQRWTGAWTYSMPDATRLGDNSNTQYALLGLAAAGDASVPVDPGLWQLARDYWALSQQRDGSWAYTVDSRAMSASMTCAGIASLAASGPRRAHAEGEEFLDGETVHQCDRGGTDGSLRRAIDWLASHFKVDQNFGSGTQWKFYYLYGLERAGRLTGTRFFGEHDWFRLGAEELVRTQSKKSGAWSGEFVERDEVLATSFALLFLGRGRAPVLINKLRHGPAGDWNNDLDDVGNLVGTVSNDWKTLVTWQLVDSTRATVADLARAPILFMNGHKAPELSWAERQTLRAYVEQGGVIFAEACCGSTEFDKGFRALMKAMFPKQEEELRPLPGDHPVWRSKHRLDPQVHPMLGIPRGFRTVVIYSPKDLSCYWNQAERVRDNPAVIRAVKIGQNVVDYVTGREVPPDKLSE